MLWMNNYMPQNKNYLPMLQLKFISIQVTMFRQYIGSNP